jgi:hypothetical protein
MLNVLERRAIRKIHSAKLPPGKHKVTSRHSLYRADIVPIGGDGGVIEFHGFCRHCGNGMILKPDGTIIA